jgi:hypothetical protein
LALLFKESVDPYLKLHWDDPENNPEKAAEAMKMMNKLFEI